MGNKISFGESLIITVFSMVVVFVGLIVLAVLISALKNLGKKKETTTTNEPVAPIKAKEPVVEKIKEHNVNDEELVAVIAAAIAASLGVSIPEINIKSIRRVSQTTSSWAVAGRQEQIYSKL